MCSFIVGSKSTSISYNGIVTVFYDVGSLGQGPGAKAVQGLFCKKKSCYTSPDNLVWYTMTFVLVVVNVTSARFCNLATPCVQSF